jgi:hypothetical protein
MNSGQTSGVQLLMLVGCPITFKESHSITIVSGYPNFYFGFVFFVSLPALYSLTPDGE